MISENNSQQNEKAACHDFVSMISHQLRTPLTCFKWTLEEVLNGDNNYNKYKEQLSDMHSSVEQAIFLVNDLSNFSRIETGNIIAERKLVDIVDIINNAIKLFKTIANKKNQRIIVVAQSNMPAVNADPLLVGEVIKNLLDNAIKYGYEDSNIEIIIRKDGERYIVGVHNYGSVIDKFENEKIFSKFYRGRNAKEGEMQGSGLGLFIARSFIEANDGNIWYESKTMGGTTFYFSIPTI